MHLFRNVEIHNWRLGDMVSMAGFNPASTQRMWVVILAQFSSPFPDGLVCWFVVCCKHMQLTKQRLTDLSRIEHPASERPLMSRLQGLE